MLWTCQNKCASSIIMWVVCVCLPKLFLMMNVFREHRLNWCLKHFLNLSFSAYLKNIFEMMGGFVYLRFQLVVLNVIIKKKVIGLWFMGTDSVTEYVFNSEYRKKLSSDCYLTSSSTGLFLLKLSCTRIVIGSLIRMDFPLSFRMNY